jgi:hypothetical protein
MILNDSDINHITITVETEQGVYRVRTTANSLRSPVTCPSRWSFFGHPLNFIIIIISWCSTLSGHCHFPYVILPGTGAILCMALKQFPVCNER